MFIFRSIDCENETQYGPTEDTTKKKKRKKEKFFTLQIKEISHAIRCTVANVLYIINEN